MRFSSPRIPALLVPLALFGCSADKFAESLAPITMPSAAADPLGQIVGMRRLTEAQYRNSIADIFGPDIVVAGQHCPLRLLHTRAAIDLVLSAIDPASHGA